MPGTIRVTLAALAALLFVYGFFGLKTLFSNWGLGFLACAAIGGLVIWREGVAQGRQVQDLATSRIATAPQGYVELIGRAAPAQDTPELISPEGRSCLWYERRTMGQRSHGYGPFGTDTPVYRVERSNQPLLIDDGSGQALLLPEHADVLGTETTVRFEGETVIKESIIRSGDPLYVVGEFHTERPDFDWHVCVDRLLTEWESDEAQRSRFDQDQDGKLDRDELRRLDAAVRAEADNRRGAALADAGTATVRNPGADKRYLIAARSVEEMDNESFFWSGLGLTMFAIFGLMSASVISSMFV